MLTVSLLALLLAFIASVDATKMGTNQVLLVISRFSPCGHCTPLLDHLCTHHRALYSQQAECVMIFGTPYIHGTTGKEDKEWEALRAKPSWKTPTMGCQGEGATQELCVKYGYEVALARFEDIKAADNAPRGLYGTQWAMIFNSQNPTIPPQAGLTRLQAWPPVWVSSDLSYWMSPRLGPGQYQEKQVCPVDAECKVGKWHSEAQILSLYNSHVFLRNMEPAARKSFFAEYSKTLKATKLKYKDKPKLINSINTFLKLAQPSFIELMLMQKALKVASPTTKYALDFQFSGHVKSLIKPKKYKAASTSPLTIGRRTPPKKRRTGATPPKITKSKISASAAHQLEANAWNMFEHEEQEKEVEQENEEERQQSQVLVASVAMMSSFSIVILTVLVCVICLAGGVLLGFAIGHQTKVKECQYAQDAV